MDRAEFWERMLYISLMPQPAGLEDNTTDAIRPLQLLLDDMEAAESVEGER